MRTSPSANIVILPFRNLSDTESARELVSPMVYREIENAGFSPISDTTVENILRKYRIRDTGQIDREDLEHITKATEADYILLGSIDMFEDDALVQLGLSARLIDGKSGEILWANSESLAFDDQVRILGIGKKQNIEHLADHGIKRLFNTFKYPFIENDSLNNGIFIIPFSNKSGMRAASQIVYNNFLSALVKRGYRVIEPGMVMSQLRENQVRSSGEIDLQTLKTIAEHFNAGYCLTGSVLQFRSALQDEETVVPAIQVSVRLIDPSTGKLVWAKLLERNGDDHFGILGLGVIHSPSRLTKSLVEELVEEITN